MGKNQTDETEGSSDGADGFGTDIWASDGTTEPPKEELELGPPLEAEGNTEAAGGSAEEAAPSASQETTLSDRLSRVTRYANAGAQDEAPPAETSDKALDAAVPESPALPEPAAIPEPATPVEPTALAERAAPSGPAEPLLQGAMGDDQVLTVGRGIRLVAKACECDALLVEGHLEANAHARMLTVSEGASFIGNAEVQTAKIMGTFEGNLSASERLVIHSGGCVSGTTRYQEIVIEAGGKILGNSQCISASPIDQLEQPSQGELTTPLVADSA